MIRLSRRFASPAILSLVNLLLAVGNASAQGPAVRSADDLVRLGPAELDALYASGTATGLPAGKIRGRAIYAPGTSFAAPASRAARLVWQGKVVDPAGDAAVNRFFGVKAVKANVYVGPSPRDGRPALILDYRRTSFVYGRNVDEIRQVAPGVYLGLMHDVGDGVAKLKMYFALESEG